MVELTAEQREAIRNTFKVTQDLIEITKNVFKNEDLDGRSQEGRAVRDFLVSEGMKYNTTKSTKKTNVELTDSQKSVLMSNQISSSMTPLEIARVVFQTPDVKSLDANHRSVIEFLEKFRPDVIDSSAKTADGKWVSPELFFRGKKGSNLSKKMIDFRSDFNKLVKKYCTTKTK